MSTSYQNSTDCFKSPRRVQVWFLKSSRDLNRNKSRQYKREYDEAQKQLKRIQKEQDRIRQENEQLKARLQELHQQKEQTEQTAAKPSIEFEDPPVGSHGYGVRMIDLAIKLVKEGIALRAVSRVLDVVFGVLGIHGKTPSYWTIRNWVQRLGHATLTQETAKANDWVWLMDHSVQIGQEKTLLVLAVRQADLPPAGEALKHEDVCAIALTPRTSWTGEDVCQELENLSQEHSVPRAIVTDHGADLVKGIQQFQQNHPQVIELYDFKHKAACCLKALLKTNERFAAFQTKVSATRNAIQQTELAFLTPPRPKTKARFMNLGPTLAWAEKMLRLLDHPAPKARQWVSEQRLEEKLGWLREFRDSVAEWSECQRVVNVGVKLANEHGIFVGAADQLRAEMPSDLGHQSSQNLAKKLTDFLAAEQAKLKVNERLPLSTEIVESSFGKFKQLERQHAREGFTGLLLGLVTLLGSYGVGTIPKLFARSKVKDVLGWINKQLGTTLASKRATTYHDCKPTTASVSKIIIRT